MGPDTSSPLVINVNKRYLSPLAQALLLVFLVSGVSLADRRPKKKENTSFSILDSTEAQWGQRSINDSIYRGYTVNGVYAERGRQKLPDSFNFYKPSTLNAETVMSSPGTGQVPTTMTIDGKSAPLKEE